MAFRDGKKSCVLCSSTSPGGGGGGGSGSRNTDVQPSGTVDGVNDTFTLPEFFEYDPAQPIGPEVHINGLRQTLGIHYSVSESGGVGTGYDTITFVTACIPQTDDLVIIDYFEAT